MIFGTITQKGLHLSPSFDELPAQHSANIQLNIVRDSSYSNYSMSAYVAFFNGYKVASAKVPVVDTMVMLPEEVFQFDGPIAISLGFTSGNEFIVTHPLHSVVQGAPGHAVNLPADETWQQLVTELMEIYFKTEADKFKPRIVDGYWYIGYESTGVLAEGVGVPDGGTAGQIIVKAKDGSNDWAEPFVRSVKGDMITAEVEKESAGALSIHGKTYQKTYTGINLLKNPSVTNSSSQNGITVTRNEDGTYTVNGTASDNAYIVLYANIQTYLETGKRYRIVGCPSGGSNDKFRFCDSNYGAYQDYGDGAFYTNNGTAFSATINVRPNVTMNNVVFKPMLVDADLYPNVTYDNYEPYVGGKASPNPDYPQEVHGVTSGKIPTGKNLLKVTGTSQTINGVSFTVNEDGTITANGTASANITYYVAQKPSLPVGELILSGGLSNALKVEGWFDVDGTMTENTVFNHTGTNSSWNIYLAIGSGQVLNNVKFCPKIQVAEDGVVVKRTGKNMLKYPYATKSHVATGMTITVNSDGSMTFNGTNNGTSALTPMFTYEADNDMRDILLNKKWRLTGAKSGASWWLQAWNYDGESGSVKDTGNGAEFTFTNKTKKYNICAYIPAGVTINNETIYPMLRVVGNGDDTFEPYSESTLSYNTAELFEGDSINAFGKLTRRFKKIVLDGVTNKLKATYFASTATSGKNRFGIDLIDSVKEYSLREIPNIWCTHLKAEAQEATYLNKDGVTSTTGRIIISIDALSTYTIEQFNAWLKAQYDAGTPVTVVYELATPTEEEPTRNGDMILTKGINHIFSGEEFSPEFDLEYSPSGYPLFDWLYPSEKIYLKSASGKEFVITVDDAGTLTATEVIV